MFAVLVSLENDFLTALKESPARYPFHCFFQCNNITLSVICRVSYAVHCVVVTGV